MSEKTVNFEFDPARTAISQALQNRQLVGQLVMPVMGVGKTAFTYNILDSNMGNFKASDSKVGKTAQPNRVSTSMRKATESTEGYALTDYVATVDSDNSDDDYDPLEASQNNLVKQLWNGHELRVANEVKKAANYGHTHALAAGEKLSNPDAHLIKVIGEHLETSLVRPNRMVLGGNVALALRCHPSVIQALSGAAITNGMASIQALADLLELDEIIIARALVDTSKKGNAPSMQKIWDNVMAAHYIDATSNPGRESTQPTWGFTASSMDLEVFTGHDSSVGTRGADAIKVAFEQKELVTAKDAGVLFTGLFA